jgi:hypothetical protein
MRYHEIIRGEGGDRLLVRASTKAGLLGAAVQGLNEAMEPRFAGEEDAAKMTERKFSVIADNFGETLAALLREQLRLVSEEGEAYDGVRLNLVTDRRIDGELLGRPAEGFGRASVRTLPPEEVVRTVEGEWEATLTLID